MQGTDGPTGTNFCCNANVVPRLTRLGLDGPAAWKNRYREAS